MQRKLKFNEKIYEITFDDDGVLDTVQCEGKFLNATNPAVKRIFKNERAIYLGSIPGGFEKVKCYS